VRFWAADLGLSGIRSCHFRRDRSKTLSAGGPYRGLRNNAQPTWRPRSHRRNVNHRRCGQRQRAFSVLGNLAGGASVCSAVCRGPAGSIPWGMDFPSDGRWGVQTCQLALGYNVKEGNVDHLKGVSAWLETEFGFSGSACTMAIGLTRMHLRVELQDRPYGPRYVGSICHTYDFAYEHVVNGERARGITGNPLNVVAFCAFPSNPYGSQGIQTGRSAPKPIAWWANDMGFFRAQGIDTYYGGNYGAVWGIWRGLGRGAWSRLLWFGGRLATTALGRNEKHRIA